LVRVIGIVSGKGGVGKTTLVANLGSVLAQKFGKKVTIIDCNITTSHLGLYLGIYYSSSTLNKVLRGEIPIEETIHPHFTGMNIIPASLSMSELDGIDITSIRDSITPILNKNDIILLDGGPGLGREAIATFRTSDELIYVTTPFVPSVLDVVRCEEIAKEFGIKSLGIVLNMVTNEKYEMTKKEIEELTNLPIISIIPYEKNVNRSLSIKTPIVSMEPKNPASMEFTRLASVLAGVKYKEQNFISRFFSSLKSKKNKLESI
jgi:septum site-determining protein MinD